MLTTMLRLLPAPLGIGIGAVGALIIMRLPQGMKFWAIQVGILAMGYFFTWYNVQMMKRDGEISSKSDLAPSPYAHLLMIAGAIIFAFGFTSGNKTLMWVAGAISIALLWVADDLLRKITPQSVDVSSNSALAQATRQHNTGNHVTDALLNAIEQKRAEDPWVGAKLGGQELYTRVLKAMTNDRGAHIDSVLCALGALAGYACQATLRAIAVTKGLPETAALTEIKTKDGKSYFFGDPLNQLLAESEFSVWAIVAGSAKEFGCTELPDLHSIFEHVAQSVGTSDFGLPRYPAGHNAADTPINFLKAMWPAVQPIMKSFCAVPNEWPVLVGVAIQEAMRAGKDVIPAKIAATLVMECAIPMSKINLNNV